jgi:hypothetical protein
MLRKRSFAQFTGPALRKMAPVLASARHSRKTSVVQTVSSLSVTLGTSSAMTPSSTSKMFGEHDKALTRVLIGLMEEVFRQFSDNPEFKRWLADTVFSIPTSHRSPRPYLSSFSRSRPTCSRYSLASSHFRFTQSSANAATSAWSICSAVKGDSAARASKRLNHHY